MANAIYDDNQIPTITGVLSTDGATVTLIKASPTTHILSTSNGTTGSDFGGSSARRDSNQRVTMTAVSEADGVTPVSLYVDSSGNLLIDSQ